MKKQFCTFEGCWLPSKLPLAVPQDWCPAPLRGVVIWWHKLSSMCGGGGAYTGESIRQLFSVTFSSMPFMVSFLVFHLCIFPIALFADFLPPSFPLSCYHINLNLFKGCHFCRICLREWVLFFSPILVSLRFVFPLELWKVELWRDDFQDDVV